MTKMIQSGKDRDRRNEYRDGKRGTGRQDWARLVSTASAEAACSHEEVSASNLGCGGSGEHGPQESEFSRHVRRGGAFP
ncbi:uncharacterized protein P884DRAFT_253715 [Thermothelomyces heterothallicus CBS 202.75]|uniref:uncharacterized protein n=1 Tax=Thermothelomyces heterothallicus CBS 202.75 TaxID=1149848 RepID=UPI00374200D7